MSSSPAPLVALVTGAATEAGRVAAEVLAGLGFHLGVEAGSGALGAPGHQHDEQTEGVVRALRRRNVRVTAAAHDLGNTEGAAAAVGGVVETFGRLDLLVVCPRLDRERSLARVDEAALLALIRHHLLETILLCQAATRQMAERGGGGRVVCLTGPAGAKGPGFGQAHLAAVASGVAGLVRALAVELTHKDITVNAIALPQRPAAARPQLETAGLEAVLQFLVSPTTRAITGQVVVVEGPKITLLRSVTSPGAVERSGDWTVEEIERRWSEIAR